MPYCNRGICPICCKPNLLSLSHHLSQVHNLSSNERKPWLKSAVFSSKSTGLSYMPPFPFWGIPSQPLSINSQPQQARQLPSTPQQPRRVAKIQASHWLEMKPYPDFKFNHMFSMLVVGPSQFGKTYFVEQLLTNNCVKYPSKKHRRIYWFYNQWQSRYATLKSKLGDEIVFTQGLPDMSEDLSEINPKFNNMLVFDDLMSSAIESSLLSSLFTQGRHRNVSVILLLQNMFMKGTFNTYISRSAQYMVLFRSPSDRKQIDIIAERIFAKDRSNFMDAYVKETEKPYGYLLVDNQPKTTMDKQVVADVFGICHCYPNTTTSTKALPVPEITLCKPETVTPKRPIDQPQVKCKQRKQTELKQATSAKRKVKTNKTSETTS